MIVGIPKETLPGENRVASVPAAVAQLAKAGIQVRVEAGAGVAAGYPDEEYRAKGAEIAASRDEIFATADVIAQVNAYGANPAAGKPDLAMLRKGQVVIGFADPLGAPQRAAELAARGVTGFAMELIPRISRAQAMDALSSMANIAGYKAVILAAERLPKMFPLSMTAAGTIKPARVFVIGAGVAGLQAIATAKRLGAVVHAYDVRSAVKEQVQSVGARFVELELDAGDAEDAGGYAREQSEDFLRRQRALMGKVIRDSDVVITTAAIPGKKAPVLVTESMVESMAPGSVIVDLAAPRGGNCALTKGVETVINGVTILGPTDLTSTVPYHASQMYANNVGKLLLHLTKDGALHIDMEDEITAGSMMCTDGKVTHARIREMLGTSDGDAGHAAGQAPAPPQPSEAPGRGRPALGEEV